MLVRVLSEMSVKYNFYENNFELSVWQAYITVELKCCKCALLCQCLFTTTFKYELHYDLIIFFMEAY